MGVRSRVVVFCSLFALALGAWCGWASGLHHSTAPAFTAWSVSLAGVVVVDLLLWRGRLDRRFALYIPRAEKPWPRPGRGGSSRVLFGISPWLILFLIVLAWELLGIDTGPHEPHLTISALGQAFHPLNAALLFVWILVGLGFGTARARAPVKTTSRGPALDTSPSAATVGLVRSTGPVPALLLPDSRAIGVFFWGGLVVVCVLLDLVARGSEGRLANIEELVRLISETEVARVLLVVAWAYAGWHLFAH